jgi:membrane protease YdiL (CAAX protease family)
VSPVPYLAIVPSLLLPLFGALVYFVLCAESALTPFICGTIKLGLLILPFAVTWRWGKARFITPSWCRLTRIISEGIISGTIMASLLLWLLLGPGLESLHLAAPQVVAKAQAFGIKDVSSFLLIAGFTSIVHAGYEEFYWRWFVFGQLSRRVPSWCAHPIAGVAFAAHHMVIGWVYAGPVVALAVGLVVAMAGMVWSQLYRRHGSLVGAWISHGCCDIALFYIQWLMISGRI